MGAYCKDNSRQLCHLGGISSLEQEIIIEIGQRTLLVILYVSAPVLGLSLIVGLVISIFQAATQIHEQTLTFIPKILSVIAAIAIFGSWMLRTIIEFTQELYTNILQYIR